MQNANAYVRPLTDAQVSRLNIQSRNIRVSARMVRTRIWHGLLTVTDQVAGRVYTRQVPMARLTREDAMADARLARDEAIQSGQLP